jgi:hypothetical protein
MELFLGCVFAPQKVGFSLTAALTCNESYANRRGFIYICMLLVGIDA